MERDEAVQVLAGVKTRLKEVEERAEEDKAKGVEAEGQLEKLVSCASFLSFLVVVVVVVERTLG